MRFNKGLPLSSLAKNNLIISAVFLLMISIFLGSIYQYWHKVLDPRLQLASQTQAEILSQSQSGTFLEALTITDSLQRVDALQSAFEQMLLITDASINQPFFKGISIEVDYDLFDVATHSLDLSAGLVNCSTCINTQVAIIDEQFNVLAIVHFTLTDAYYGWLSSDLKNELKIQALIALFLFGMVWLIILLLVSRLNKVKRKIELADHAKTRFIANVSHELRTPLNSILGYTQLFKKDEHLMNAQGQGIKTIHNSAEHLLFLINDILDFSKTDSQTVQLKPSPVNLMSFLSTIIEISDISARAKLLDLDFNFSKNLPEYVLVDEQRLRQVLLNLITNAIKFTEKGKVTFSVEQVKIEQANNQANSQTNSVLKFSINDSGIGISSSMLDSIFMPYQQVENRFTTSGGAGLGLAISKNLLSLMGGALKVESKLDIGSRFFFEITLPVVTPQSTSAQNEIGKLNNNALFNQANIDVDADVDIDEATLNTIPSQWPLPEKAILIKLKEHAIKHDILAIKQVITQLDSQPNLQKFTQRIKTLVQKYQFAQLIELLQSLE